MMPKRQREGTATDQMTETEGERQLKRLLCQQLDKSISLEEQFDRHRTFHSATKYTPLTAELSGQMSVGQFQVEESRKEKVDDLRQLGLTEEEIRLTFDEKLSVGLGMEPGILQNHLSVIEEKVTRRNAVMPESSSFRDAKVLSRHEMELERSLKPNSKQAQLLMQLVTTDKLKAEKLKDDPMNCLKEMEKELLDRVGEVYERKKRQSDSQETVPAVTVVEESRVGEWQPVEEAADISTMRLKPLITEDDPVMRDYVVPISDEVIEGNRMNIDDIRNLPRFGDYDKGKPSNVLYIKNLANNVTETDLVALFGRYQKVQDLKFRLMKGKMRGQAFVTFPDEDTASKALHFIHGFVWKGKPIMIQYGNRANP